MPERSQRLLWLYVGPVDQPLAAEINEANQKFACTWTLSRLQCIPCVDSATVSARLWLIQLQMTDQRTATEFNRQLAAHIDKLGTLVGQPNLYAKRQTNLPQPLVCPRLGPWPKTDIGLHSVNDMYNGVLVTYTYHEGRFYHVPHLQLSQLTALGAGIEAAWSTVPCTCWQTSPACCGVGCFKCFRVACVHCQGTGWKDFSRWLHGGCRVDYSSGVPLAIVESGSLTEPAN
jgi:hypothetical protein